MMPPPTWYSSARLYSPCSMIAALAVVPPMSKVMTFGDAARRASACAPTTPPAGPDSMMCMGLAAAAAAPIRPPFDCMIRSGARTPRAARSASQAREVARDDRHDVGVDHGGRGALVLLDLGQHLGAERERHLGREALDDLP